MKARLQILLTIVLIGSMHRPARAFECIEGAGPHNVSLLETTDPDNALVGGSSTVEIAIYCLLLDSFHLGEGHWDTQSAALQITTLREHPLRPRIHDAAEKLRATEWGRYNSRQLCALAARFGIARLGSLDVYTRIVEDPSRLPYVSLAVLRDERTYSLLERRYRALGIDRDTDEARAERNDIVSCLYHLPGNQATILARTLADAERDPDLRDRLIHIASR